MKTQHNSRGFSAAIVLVALCVVGAVGFIGWYVLHTRTVKDKTSTTQTSTSTSSSKQTAKSTPTDPYAGWKSFCDSYHYCLKYPADWQLTPHSTATVPCSVGQITIANSDDSVEVNYINANNHDHTDSSFTTTKLIPLGTANQPLTLVEGYSTYGNGYSSLLTVTKNSLVQSANLEVGKQAQFSLTGGFDDLATGSSSCSASLTAQPLQPLPNATTAQSWATTSSGHISELILESLTYQPQ